MNDDHADKQRLEYLLTEFDDRLRRGLTPGQDTGSDELQSLAPWAIPLLEMMEQRWPRSTKSFPEAEQLATAMVLQSPSDLASRLRTLGRFRIEEELGHGGFGVVFKAYDPTLNRHVALKVPRGESLVTREYRQRFLREAEAGAGMDHPYLVPVYEVGDAGGVCYIASAYCPGVDLARRLAEDGTRFSDRETATIVAILASAIDHAHSRGVLHRDLKPSNVLLFPEPMTGQDRGWEDLPFTPRITDFGLAKLVERSLKETRTSVILGTPLYMAPEQATGHGSDRGPQADIFSLGAILYELLTGQTPFDGPTLLSVLDHVRNEDPTPPRRHRPGIPQDLETICLKCLQKDPYDRYTSARELAADLGRFLNGEAILARPPSVFDRLRLWSRRPERVRDAGLMAIGGGVVLAIWVVFGICGGVALGVIEEMSPQLATDTAVVAVGLLLPMIWIGTQTLKKRSYAIWGGLFLSAGTSCANLLTLVGPVTVFSEVYDANPYARWIVHLLLTLLFGFQTLAYAIALRAYRAAQKSAQT